MRDCFNGIGSWLCDGNNEFEVPGKIDITATGE